MVRKVNILNVIPFKLYKVVKKMEADCEAAYQIAFNMRNMPRDTFDLAVQNGLDPDKTEIDMLNIVDEIEGRLGRIGEIVSHFNQFPEYIDQEVMEDLIYGESLTDTGTIDERLKA